MKIKTSDFKSIVLEVLNEELGIKKEDTVLATTSGTSTDMTPDQKAKAKLALAKGDAVKTVKKNTNLQEKDEDKKDGAEMKVDRICENINEAIAELSQVSENTEDKKQKSHSENVLKHLKRASEALTALRGHESKVAENLSLEEEKEINKHIDQVKKHLNKKLKDKKDVEPLIKKYEPVIRKLHKKKDAVQTTEAIWGHMLREAKNNKAPK